MFDQFPDSTIYFILLKNFVYQTLLLLQVQGVFRKKENGQVIASTGEKRLIIILSYYILFGIISMVTVSLSTKNTPYESIMTHFSCEALGYTPGKCDRSIFEQHTISWLLTLTFVLHGLVPVVSLVFVLDIREFKAQMLKRCFRSIPGRQTTLILHRSIHRLYANRMSSNTSFSPPTRS